MVGSKQPNAAPANIPIPIVNSKKRCNSHRTNVPKAAIRRNGRRTTISAKLDRQRIHAGMHVKAAQIPKIFRNRISQARRNASNNNPAITMMQPHCVACVSFSIETLHSEAGAFINQLLSPVGGGARQMK